MPTNLANSPVNTTFNQLLHVDDGPTSQEKTVYGGAGVATALKVSTESVSVDNVRIDGSTISTVDANTDLVLTSNGGSVRVNGLNVSGGQISNANITNSQISNTNITGGQINADITGGTFHGITPTQAGLDLLDDADAAAQRQTLGLGTLATQDANNVNITGGQINADITGGTFHGVTPTQAGLNLLDDADAAAQRVTLGLGTAATKNEGSGSGLDADLLDGLDSTQFLRSDVSLLGFQTDGRHAIFNGDLNTIDKNSIYNFVGSSVTNAPPGIGSSWAFVHTMMHTLSDAWGIQIVYSMDAGDGKIYIRHKHNGVWGNWIAVWTSTNNNV